MTTSQSNVSKIRERGYLDQARSLLETLPCGDCEVHESPDFVIAGPRECCGIEVTLFAWPRRDTRIPQYRYRAILPRHLQRILDRKARQLRHYATPPGRTWLLVVLDRRFPGCVGWVTPALLEARYSSPFAGVALLEFTVSKCWELNISLRA